MSEINQEQLKKEAGNFLDTLEPQVTATVVGLYGDLGAGKTTFTKALAEVLGVTQAVTSPTFVLEKIYKLNNQKFQHLIHIDAYRLESSSELKQLGWDSIVSDKNNLIVVEWADRIEDLLPQHTKKISFDMIDGSTQFNTRSISYES
jgi:tRNA threonylcarbamoyladenosine biosynthesis protein TsaE